MIQNLNSNRAHGHDSICIRMVKVCGYAINKLLKLILRKLLSQPNILLIGKKSNIVPVHKKGNKQNIKNYHPVPLLPICSKVFERILFSNMLSFFLENNLITQKQSAFKPGDPCIKQLLSIIHQI